MDAFLGACLPILILRSARPATGSPDNPFIGATSFNGTPVNPANVRTEFWAVGQRNPHRMHFDRKTGEIYTGDVGRRDARKSIASSRGQYGWVFYEGTLTNSHSLMVRRPRPWFPLFHPTNMAGPERSQYAGLGGHRWAGLLWNQLPVARRQIHFGDYISAHIWAMTFHGSSKPTVNRLVTGDYGPTGFGLHPGTGRFSLRNETGRKFRVLSGRSVWVPRFQQP